MYFLFVMNNTREIVKTKWLKRVVTWGSDIDRVYIVYKLVFVFNISMRVGLCCYYVHCILGSQPTGLINFDNTVQLVISGLIWRSANPDMEKSGYHKVIYK